MAENENTSGIDGLFFDFKDSLVKNVIFDFAFAHVVVIDGEFFSVETRGTLNENFECLVTSDNTMIVRNKNPIDQFRFFRHERNQIVPKILITIPSGSSFESFKLKIKAGSFSIKSSELKCKEGFVKANAAEVKIDSLKGGRIDFSCGAGSINFDGTLKGKCDIDCGMGSIILNIRGNKADYSCDCKTALGAVKVNDEMLGAFGRSYAESILENHISVNCGMGNVNINIHKF